MIVKLFNFSRFLKLKDFLITLKDKVTIEMQNTNNSYAILNPNYLTQL